MAGDIIVNDEYFIDVEVGMKQVQRLIYIIPIILVLVTCGTEEDDIVSTVSTPDVNSTAVLMASTMLAQTMTAIPTPSAPLTEIPLPLTQTPLSFAELKGLRMAYIIGGNLYFQEGNNTATQLTYSGDVSDPKFSADGEKIIFYRGLVPHDLFSINTDGTQESALVTGSLLKAFDSGYDGFTEISSLAFVPGVHQVLFTTLQLSQGDIDRKDFNRLGSEANLDLLSVNIDNAEIKRLLPNGKGGNFSISPNGNMVAIQASGHIDVIDIDGRMISRDFVTYTPTHPYVLNPHVSWTSDSSELIVALPVRDIYDMSGPETYSIWRYAIDSHNRTQLTFEPHPLDNCCASPDGNWFLYPYYYYPGKTNDQIPSGLYLGNMQNDSMELYDSNYLAYYWSSDNEHFIYGETTLFLGSVNERPSLIDNGRFLGWLNAKSFLYYSFEDSMPFVGEVGRDSIPVQTTMPKGLVLQGAGAFAFTFTDN